MNNLNQIISHFSINGTVADVKPLGNGLINDTYKITTAEADAPDYVLQRINDSIFTDVDLLQHNIEEVTTHIRELLVKEGADDIDRRVLTFIKADNGKTYIKDEEGKYWRISMFIPDAVTVDAVNPESSYHAGKAFGKFESQVADITDRLGETIPDFHNMELRRDQLRQAVKEDRAGRAAGVKDFIDEIEKYMDEMCLGERLFHRQVFHHVGAVAVPYLCHQAVPLGVVALEVGLYGGALAADGGASLGEAGYRLELVDGHPCHLAVYYQQSIAHSCLGSELLSIVAEHVHERAGVHVVEVIATGNGGMVVGEAAGDAVVAAIVVGDVCHVFALLHHVAGAAEIVGPWAGLLCPGLVAVEPLAVDG